MKKTLLATAIPALLIANVANAAELYTDDKSTFSVGGHISAGLTGSDEGETGVESISPRINFGATHHLDNGFQADALVEWAINTDGGEQALETRLAYVGLTHADYGRTVLGTQWAPTFDVTGVADMPIAFANDFLYRDDMAKMGTARADDMLSYRNGVDFGESMALNIGLGWQGAQGDYDARYQGALSFDFDKFNIGVAYNSGDVNYTAQRETATSTHISAKYGSYGNGLYVAAVYGQNEFAYRPGTNGDSVYDETTDIEAIVAYAFENSVNVSLNYEEIIDEMNSDTLLKQTAIQVEYDVSSNLIGYVGYQVDLGTDLVGHKDDNIWALGVRYKL